METRRISKSENTFGRSKYTHIPPMAFADSTVWGTQRIARKFRFFTAVSHERGRRGSLCESLVPQGRFVLIARPIQAVPRLMGCSRECLMYWSACARPPYHCRMNARLPSGG